MTPDVRLKLKNLLVQDESYKQFPYTDTTGHLTIGIGRNLSTRGISSTEALYLLDDDINYFLTKLSALLPFFNALDDNRKVVLVNMCFNLGVQGLLEFKDMLGYVERTQYTEAAQEILDSKAAHQDVDRYHQLAYIMKTGEL